MIKRLNGPTVWVGYPAFGDRSRIVVGTVPSLVLREIGSTMRKFVYGKREDSGRVVSEVRGKDGVWIVFETDLLKIRGTGRKKGAVVGKVSGGSENRDEWYDGK